CRAPTEINKNSNTVDFRGTAFDILGDAARVDRAVPLHPADAAPIALARHLIFSATTPGLIVPCPY
ncbi:hypothetical protein, partial [Microseira wollei]|uniref:hypothetical protein n=1 Tax=Microseira wollei TaxID=467598 RepID=UPI001CFF314E